MTKIYLDTETTGLNANMHSILTIGAIFEKDGEIIEEKTYKIEPLADKIIDDEALEINGINLEEHIEEAKPKEQVKEEFLNDISKYESVKIVCHNARFDKKFLRQVLEGEKPYEELICTYQMASILKARGELSKRDLENVAKQFNIEIEEEKLHSELYDARICMKVHKKMMEVI